MDENEQNTVVEESEKTSNDTDGLGCIIWPYTIVSTLISVLFIIWLIQGRPDTWYGSLFRFQFKLILWILGLLVGIVVIFLIKYGIVSLLEKCRSKKTEEGDDEEKQ